MAKRLLRDLQSTEAVLAASPERLTPLCGEDAAALIETVREVLRQMLQRTAYAGPILSTGAALADYLFVTMANEAAEEVRVIFLNARHRLIADEVLFRGSISEAPCCPRDILRRALELGAVGLIVVHNHPSGDPTPSREDLRRTAELSVAAKTHGMNLLDHLIVASSGQTSLRALGYL